MVSSPILFQFFKSLDASISTLTPSSPVTRKRKVPPSVSSGCASAGRSATGVTLIVMVFGTESRSTPPFVVPPSSCTWNVKLLYGVPFPLGAGVNVMETFPCDVWIRPPTQFSPTGWPLSTAATLVPSAEHATQLPFQSVVVGLQ